MATKSTCTLWYVPWAKKLVPVKYAIVFRHYRPWTTWEGINIQIDKYCCTKYCNHQLSYCLCNVNMHTAYMYVTYTHIYWYDMHVYTRTKCSSSKLLLTFFWPKTRSHPSTSEDLCSVITHGSQTLHLDNDFSMKSPTLLNNVEHSCRPLQLISTSCCSGDNAFWKHLAITSHFLKAQGSRGPDLKCYTIHSILPGLNQTPRDHLTQIQSWCRLESFLLWYNTRSKGSGLINYPDFQYFGSIENFQQPQNMNHSELSRSFTAVVLPFLGAKESCQVCQDCLG